MVIFILILKYPDLKNKSMYANPRLRELTQAHRLLGALTRLHNTAVDQEEIINLDLRLPLAHRIR
jgi:hypothetical protein